MTNGDPFYYEDESADLAAEMDADRRAERELELGPEDDWTPLEVVTLAPDGWKDRPMTATDSYVTDAATDWECQAGASLIVEAMTPGPGALGTMHGVIYVCPEHQDEAESLIGATNCIPETRDAPPGHRWNPWPCGHITAFGPQKGPAFLAALLPGTG
ncbi:hypothetical protein [Streptomyces halstedii]|uniref:hypothetical protein n=1 Tax=Streptomyces halstedii TaxID=1944 RepID=UPI00345FD6BD